MPTTHPSRIFRNGAANTLYLTLPATIVGDSQFPFDADADVTVTIDDGRLIVTEEE